MDDKSFKVVLLKGVIEELMETFNLLENEDIFLLEYEDIKKVFKNYFMSIRKKSRND